MSATLKDVFFIAGLGHSGSTLLGAYLGQYGNSVMLGEIEPMLKGKSNTHPQRHLVMDSCGVHVDECPVWGAFLQDTSALSGTLTDRYRRFITHKVLDSYQFVIDTSHSFSALIALKQLEREGVARVHVVHLMRDVRAWSNSLYRRDDINRTGMWPIPFLSHLYYALSWYRNNRNMLDSLAAHQFAYLPMSYEQFCVAPHTVATKILEQAGISKEAATPLHAPKTHIAYGGDVRYDASVLSNIRYDTRWMGDYAASVAAVLLFPIFFWNRRFVLHMKDGERFKTSVSKTNS